MPTVWRFDGLRVVIYSSDHRPEHVHVIGAGVEAVFILHCPAGPPELWENYGFSRPQAGRIKDALAARLLSSAASGKRFMAVNEQEFAQAQKRGRLRRRTGYAVAAQYDPRKSRIVVYFNNGLELAFPPLLMQGLAGASPEELADIEISPAGVGLHWPKLDADLYIPALLRGIFGSRRWMAAQLGAAGGRVQNEAKAVSSRANGRKGGRPRTKMANG
jgi:hypothetical protein